MERPLTGNRVALLIAYDGRSFSGWQVQPSDRTIQGVIENSLAALANQPVRITGAGRTDAGVSAWGQVAHLDLPASFSIPADRLGRVLNQSLPPEIRILESRQVGPEFHARYRATQKIYKYSFRWLPGTLFRHPGDNPASSPLRSPFVLGKAISASRFFVGPHDFRHFTVGSSCPDDPVRTVTGIFWEKTPDGLSFWISGPGFLHRMVRMIGGFLRDIGQGAREEREIPPLLEPGSSHGPSRSVAPLPPEGLALVRVLYGAIDPFDPRTQNEYTLL
jgi:tRNA pseudouridine38-40 synthase